MGVLLASVSQIIRGPHSEQRKSLHQGITITLQSFQESLSFISFGSTLGDLFVMVSKKLNCLDAVGDELNRRDFAAR